METVPQSQRETISEKGDQDWVSSRVPTACKLDAVASPPFQKFES